MFQVIVCAAVGVGIAGVILVLFNHLGILQQKSGVVAAQVQGPGFSTKKSESAQNPEAPLKTDMTPPLKPELVTILPVVQDEPVEDEVLADFLRQSKTEEERQQILEFAQAQRQKEIEDTLSDEMDPDEEMPESEFEPNEFVDDRDDEEQNTKEIFRCPEISFIPSFVVTKDNLQVTEPLKKREEKHDQVPIEKEEDQEL